MKLDLDPLCQDHKVYDISSQWQSGPTSRPSGLEIGLPQEFNIKLRACLGVCCVPVSTSLVSVWGRGDLTSSILKVCCSQHGERVKERLTAIS